MEAHHLSIEIGLLLLLAIMIHQYLVLRDRKHTLHGKTGQEQCSDGPRQLDEMAGNSKPYHLKEKEDVLQIIEGQGSSVFCHGSNHTTRRCHFTNLCYDARNEKFMFFHHENSVIHGVPFDRHSPALLDVSSISDLNVNYFNYEDHRASDSHSVLGQRILFINQTALIVKRFKPDNLMHVLHDDLLPVFFTMKMMSNQNTFRKADILLVFIDSFFKPQPDLHGQDFDFLYKTLSTYDPIQISEVDVMKHGEKPRYDSICFRDVHVGLDTSTKWYQYGYLSPQGPILNSQVSVFQIHQMKKFIIDALYLPVAPDEIDSDGSDIVLLTRKGNRLIINELDLTLSLARAFKRKVRTLSMETHTLKEIIAAVAKASVVIGMHGSLLSVAMFISYGSVLIEMFPYAVNPDLITPYKTLANIPGMGIVYRSWRNQDPLKTVTHPEWEWYEGGISHLSGSEQEAIRISNEVPPHLCCDNPEWLFRIFQDTTVDIPTIVQIIHDALQVRKELPSFKVAMGDLIESRLDPVEVPKIKCSVHCQPGSKGLLLEWETPGNMRLLDTAGIQYEIWIQKEDSDEVAAWITSQTHHFVAERELVQSVAYRVWIRCISRHQRLGPFNKKLVLCNFDCS